MGNLNARVQRKLEFVPAFDCTLEYRKVNDNDIVGFSGLFSRAFYGVRPQWLDKLQPRGVDKSKPRWR